VKTLHANQNSILRTFDTIVNRVISFSALSVASVTGSMSLGIHLRRKDLCVGDLMLLKRSRIMRQISEVQLRPMNFTSCTKLLMDAMVLT